MRTSMLFMPYWSRAVVAVESEACCAAYGVPLREPLKPTAPEEDQHKVRPSESVMVICVLLNDAAMCATPCGTMRFSRFFLNSFLRFAAAPPATGFPGACVASCAAFGSLATFCSVSLDAEILQTCADCLALLALGLLLGCDGATTRTFTRAGVGVRALPANRKIAPVADAAVRLNFDQPANVHLDLLAEIAFDAAFFFNFLAKTVHFVFGQVANFLGGIDVRLFRELLSAHLSDSIDRSQSDPKALLRRKIYTCDTSHADFSCLSKTLKSKTFLKRENYPCRCLCFGLEQITRTTPRR